MDTSEAHVMSGASAGQWGHERGEGGTQWSGHGQHMSPHTGDWSVSPVHWSVRRSHWTQDFSNLRKLERNCDKTRARPCLATLGGRGGDGVS